MENEEKIDVLIATYNGQEFLRQQLDSIINQTYKNIRILISDDCSTDNTREILKEYKQKDDRIILYFQDENLGYIKNFEFLLQKVESEFFALCDQDDIWLEEKIEKSYKKLADSNSDLVHSDLEVIDSNNNVIYESRWKKMGLSKKVKYDDLRSLYLYNCVTGCTLMAKSKFIKDILPLPYKSKYMVHDYWISLVIALKGKITHIDEKLIQYRQHETNQIGTRRTSTSMNSFDDVRDLFINVKEEHFNDYIERENIFTQEQRELNEKALKYFEHLKNVKYINFKYLSVYHKLYKYETLGYYLLQFLILNMPCISRFGFKIFKIIQKLIYRKGRK